MKEDQEAGQVTGKVYWQYIRSYGVISFVALILLWSSEQVGFRLGRGGPAADGSRPCHGKHQHCSATHLVLAG